MSSYIGPSETLHGILKSAEVHSMTCCQCCPPFLPLLCGTDLLFLISIFLSFLACLDGAEVSASGLKIGRSPVQISPKTNFSIMIKLPVKSTGKKSRIRFDLKKLTTCWVSNTCTIQYSTSIYPASWSNLMRLFF